MASSSGTDTLFKNQVLQMALYEASYNDLFSQYQQCVQDFQFLISQPQSSTEFVSISGKTFMPVLATGTIQPSATVDTEQMCIEACRSSPSCAGATFNTQTKACVTATAGKLGNSADSHNVAIVSVTAAYSKMQAVNQQLVELVVKIDSLLAVIDATGGGGKNNVQKTRAAFEEKKQTLLRQQSAIQQMNSIVNLPVSNNTVESKQLRLKLFSLLAIGVIGLLLMLCFEIPFNWFAMGTIFTLVTMLIFNMWLWVFVTLFIFLAYKLLFSRQQVNNNMNIE